MWLLVAGAAAEEIRVVAWNIQWFPGKQFTQATPAMERRQMEVAQKVVKSLGTDVLLGQELRDWKSFDRLVSVDPAMKVSTVSHFPDRDTGRLWKQQTAIASKLPVLASWSQPWETTLGAMTRGFSFAAVEVPGDKVLLVYSVHLKSNYSHTEEGREVNFRVRDESIAQLLEHVDRMERLMWAGKVAGVIVGGDFNTNHDAQFGDRVVEQMVSAGFTNTWEKVPQAKRLTWRGSDEFRATTFDYLFVKGERLGFGQAELVKVPEAASDHHAVSLMIEVR